MKGLIEFDIVEESKDLVPNLCYFAEAIFIKDYYLIDWYKSQVDWATNKIKRPDGMIWLPWKNQIWLIELEWKQGSNFFDQSRAFSEGEINVDKLRKSLLSCISHTEETINSSAHSLIPGLVNKNIVEKTISVHVHDNRLKPHIWVILGHDGNNILQLKNDYEKELQARFRESQQYLLTTVRMFRNECSSYYLLDNSPSSNFSTPYDLPKSLLVLGKNTDVKNATTTIQPSKEIVGSSFSPPQKSVVHIEELPQIAPVQNIPESTKTQGRALDLLSLLKESKPDLVESNIRLRAIIQNKNHDFKIAWNHPSSKIFIIGPSGYPQVMGMALRDIYPNLPDVSHLARKSGVFIDISTDPPTKIISYWDAERALKSTDQFTEDGLNQEYSEPCMFFDELNVRKHHLIQRNILDRAKLWEEFIATGIFNDYDFHKYSEFQPKAIAGFMKFLTIHKIAKRIGNKFIINKQATDKIKSVIYKGLY